MNLIKRAWTSEAYACIYDETFQTIAEQKRNAAAAAATAAVAQEIDPTINVATITNNTNNNNNTINNNNHDSYEYLVETEIVNQNIDLYPSYTHRTAAEAAVELQEEEGK